MPVWENIMNRRIALRLTGAVVATALLAFDSAAPSPGQTLTAQRNAGIATYGHSRLADDVDDVRAHGKDERVAVKSFRESGEYLYRLVKRLSGGN
jgi:acetylornithine deacetylase/succinyl-diaminopimelate desuccinylase-like protein